MREYPMIGRLAAFFLIFAGGSAAAVPSIAADAAKGTQLARQWCAHCHVVAAGQSATVQQGPPAFTAIGMNADQMRAFLTRPHGAMPDLALTRSEIDDVIAYIETLR
jgi:mono/diheme cytochrome c family protein